MLVAKADLRRQCSGREEAEAGGPLVHQRGAAQHLQVVVLKDHSARLRGLRHPGPAVQRAHVGRHLPKLGGSTVEVAEVKVLFAVERGAGIGGQPSAGLKRRFQQHCEG